jgi:hypothetical protein
VVRSVLQGDPLSGDLFVFRNRNGDKLKILAWMGDGFPLAAARTQSRKRLFCALFPLDVIFPDPLKISEINFSRRIPSAPLGPGAKPPFSFPSLTKDLSCSRSPIPLPSTFVLGSGGGS